MPPRVSSNWRDRLRASDPRRRIALITALAVMAVVTLLLVFDWNWLRGPLERRIARSTSRDVAIGSVEGQWQRGPRLVLRDVAVGHADARGVPLFRAETVYFDLTLAPLLRGELRLTEVGLTSARIQLHRDKDGRVNWAAASKRDEPTHRDDEREPLWKRIHVGTLALDDVVLTLRDEKSQVEARARVDTLPPREQTARWRTRVTVTGRYEDSPFAGEALTGPFITLRDTGTPFPVRARVDVARTRVEADGEVADLLGYTSIDARLVIAGPTLSSLYPTLPIVLPSTPPYRLQGRLRLHERIYRLDDIIGRIGRSDVRGKGEFDTRGERPMLTATLVSERLALADLGAAVGIPQTDAARAAQTRVFPDENFNIPRLNAMNAEVSLTARRLIVRPEVPLEDLELRVGLAAGVLTLKPLQFGFAGGEIVSTIVLDARMKPMAAEAAIDLRRVQFARLFPTLDTNRVSAGELGAQIRLSGRGQSVASLLGSANGTVAAAMSGGRISHTVIAAASLDGGKLLPLLLRGDEPVALRCAALSMAVEQGIARTHLFDLDAETARIDGEGAIDLRAERFALELDSKPKEPSILSVRAPLNVEGTFRDPRVTVSSGTLLRGGAAIALAAVNPLAGLIPLIETGPGDDANCAQLLAPVESAAKQARQASDRPPPVSKKSAAARR